VKGQAGHCTATHLHRREMAVVPGRGPIHRIDVRWATVDLHIRHRAILPSDALARPVAEQRIRPSRRLALTLIEYPDLPPIGLAESAYASRSVIVMAPARRPELPMIGRAGIDRSASPHPPDHHHGQPLYPRSPGIGCTVRPAAVRN
jgi:hypothetical protein